MNLTSLQSDRAAGVLIALAAGDALGAGYEFEPAMPDDAEVAMIGGGPFNFEPAEWTDDTSMALAIADAILESPTFRLDESAKDATVRAWADWALTSKDVGAQTGTVLSRARRAAADAGRPVTAADALEASEQLHRTSGRSAGNGSLMRTAPLALAYLDSPAAELRDVAMELSALTHFDP